MQGAMRKTAIELLQAGTVDRVLGWKKGLLPEEREIAIFREKEEIEQELVYDPCCGQNLSKTLIQESQKIGRILVFLRPCDGAGYDLLLREHRLRPEGVYTVGIPCPGVLDLVKLGEKYPQGLNSLEMVGDEVQLSAQGKAETLPLASLLAETCQSCARVSPVAYEMSLGEGQEQPKPLALDPYAKVKEIEALSPEERFRFWQGELSRCIRCNACRNVCPACSCRQCVFDNPASGVANKAAADAFEEKLFHLIRAYHVAGRCVDCGQCDRVCPEHIPLHLLNRKLRQDLTAFYGEAAGALTAYALTDAEPGQEKGGGK